MSYTVFPSGLTHTNPRRPNNLLEIVASPRGSSIVSYESDVLGMGKTKNYRFELGESLQDDDWARYQRLMP